MRDPVIEQFLIKSEPDLHGKYYVFDAQDETDEFHLHGDGRWRSGTFDEETGEWSGYFDTEEDAKNAIVKYNTLQD